MYWVKKDSGLKDRLEPLSIPPSFLSLSPVFRDRVLHVVQASLGLQAVSCLSVLSTGRMEMNLHAQPSLLSVTGIGKVKPPLLPPAVLRLGHGFRLPDLKALFLGEQPSAKNQTPHFWFSQNRLR